MPEGSYPVSSNSESSNSQSSFNPANQSLSVAPQFSSTEIPKFAIKAAKWMGFFGYVLIISGGFYCLSIIGAIIGVPYILAGLKLNKAADKLQEFIQSADTRNLQEWLENQSSHYFILGIIMIVGLIFMVLYIIVLIGIIAYTAANKAGGQ
ncbi:MAG: DUF5362 domain-containing protein [Candidatus Melainabacteria bacterium]|jgi:hypothetical protein